MASEVPQTRLVIDQSFGGSEASGAALVWNPGNTLSGHFQLSSKYEMDISSVSIYFEGISRNWISQKTELYLNPTPYKLEHKFLSQVQNIAPTDISRVNISLDHFVYTASFHFNIPGAMPRLRLELPEHCLQLPPSLELGDLLVDTETGKVFAQPSIKYLLRCLVAFDNRENDGDNTIETTLPVTMAPHTEEFPPTETEDFPAEFKKQDGKILRRHLMARALGELAISMQEPPALRFEGQVPQAKTSASAKLEFKPESSGQIHQTLQGLSFTIFSLIRVKTFYSLETFPRLPSQTSLGPHGTTRMRDEMIKLETRTLRDLSWKYIYELGSHAEEAGPQISSGPPRGKWTATLEIPIKSDTRLTPTFCTSVVARLYSIIVRVKVEGIRTESFDLEVPLQVIHSLRASAEIFGREESFEHFRRESDSSWLSEESLESARDPPGYYP